MRRIRQRLAQRPSLDDGFTLVELMVAMIVFSILLAMTAPLIGTFYNVDTNVTNTVGTIGQILPATTVLERYLRSAVAPAPGGIPPFASITPAAAAAAGYPAGTLYQAGSNQMSFYSNTGDEVTSGPLTGDAIGPRLVTLTVSGPGTCPGSGPAMSQKTGATCSYTGQPNKLDFTINNVTNGAQASANPIFQYIAGITSAGLPNVISPVPVSATALLSVTGVQIDMESQKTLGGLTSFRTTVLFFASSYSANVG
jgi:prepilin-type N-terminal cleavage/methylation domain-containing protein